MKSERMNRVLAVLESHPMVSTKEIEDLAQVAAARDYITRLRAKGYIIEMVEKWVDGCRICRYNLRGSLWEGVAV